MQTNLKNFAFPAPSLRALTKNHLDHFVKINGPDHRNLNTWFSTKLVAVALPASLDSVLVHQQNHSVPSNSLVGKSLAAHENASQNVDLPDVNNWTNPPMRKLHYFVYDVFTKVPLAGNQLGVIPDASGLSGSEMQAIARELNLAETIFFLPPEDARHSAKVRIFMPLGELPFAGHPTIGGAIAYAGINGLPHDVDVILEEGVGPVHCTVSADSMGGKSSFTAARLPTQMDLVANDFDVAAALGLSVDDLDIGVHQVMMVSGGVPYVTVPVKCPDALARARVNADAWMALDVWREGKFAAPYLYCAVGESQFRVRMFAPWDGIPEDPATGSAAVAFARTLHNYPCQAPGNYSFHITQGVEMGRRSEIGLSFSVQGAGLSGVSLSGEAVKFAEGTIFLPD